MDNRQLIDAFGEAWGARDIDGVMDLMAPKCSFSASVGPDPGRTYLGPSEVRRGVESFLGPPADPDVVTETLAVRIGDDFAVVHWVARSTHPDRPTPVIRALDVFEFDDGRIRSKDTYRKVLG